MRIGIDFDNTIVSYDRLFYEYGVESGIYPGSLPQLRIAVRDHLKSLGRHDEWISLQSTIYAEAIIQSPPFSGVKEFLVDARGKHQLFIISHKTRFTNQEPYRDLHAAAKCWLESNNFFDLVEPENVYFEESRLSKIRKISISECDLFIDDLLDIFENSEFPKGVKKYLFDPHQQYDEMSDLNKVENWHLLKKLIL